MPKQQPQPWEERWVREGGSLGGGQGDSFIARPKVGGGPRVFVKTLRDDRVRDRRARGRFRREVGIYESLDGLGLPRLIDHNAATWKDCRTPLYLVTDLIEGVNLRTYIKARQQISDINTALECVRELAEVLNRCHENGVIHRDVKPANIVLRDSDPTKPVLVDFGISFNDAEEDDLTRLNEEIGNRFLRLPEHATGGRAAASDVTQLAAIFLYTVTGHEPRILRDADGNMPHHRPEARSVLSDLLDRRQLLRVMSILDKAFANQLARRYATAPELVSELERAMQNDQADGGDLEDLRAQLAEIVDSRGIGLRNQRRDGLYQLMHRIHNTVRDFATANGGLYTATSANKLYVTSADELHWNERKLSMSDGLDNNPRTWMLFRAERHGDAGDYTVLVDGDQIWRGEKANEALTEAVQTVVANHMLAILSDPSQDSSIQP